jgi:thiamine-monophosphate kinase
VATVDAVAEGVHFDGRFAPEDVGWKALAVNLSDLAAMGARPLWALCALAVPRGADPARLSRVGRGLAACARRFGVALAGGNVSRGPALSLTVTALGAVSPGRALRRRGARPGDLLLLSGALGGAAWGRRRGAPPEALRRQRRPEPRLALGRALAGLASACIDVSDGLLQDLGHLCRASGVGAEVWLEDLPLAAGLGEAARSQADLEALALAGGEDYELLAAVPPGRLSRALALERRLRLPLQVAGRITSGRGAVARGLRGERLRPRGAGWDHLAS